MFGAPRTRRFYFCNPLCMDTQLPDGCLEERFKGNLRIRLYDFSNDVESPAYLVDVTAWNTWAGQGKIVAVVGGIDLESAKRMLQEFTADISHYDWEKGEVVMEDEPAGAGT